MNRHLLGTLFAVVLGCNPSTPTTDPNGIDDDSGQPVDHGDTGDHGNSGVNVRDRDDSAKTPIDQNENQSDIDVTAEIRSRVVDTEMSVNAQNIKIMTQDGRVTLRGPVQSEDEKAQIEKMAEDVAGAENVDNQLEVQP